MNRKKRFIIENTKIAVLSAIFIAVCAFLTICLPFMALNFIPQSGIGNYAFEYVEYAYGSLFILIYVLYVGIFHYRIKVTRYVIEITSKRIVFGYFKPPNYIEISSDSLVEYSFFNRPFSFNKILMIRVKNEQGKVFAKRFYMTFLSNKNQKKLSDKLQNITQINSS